MPGTRARPTDEARLRSELRLLRERGILRAREVSLPLLAAIAEDVDGPSADRARGIEQLLRRALELLEGTELKEATSLLFGLAPGRRGARPSELRQFAADARGVSPDTFRKHHEPLLIADLAGAIVTLREAPRPSGTDGDSPAERSPASQHGAFLTAQQFEEAFEAALESGLYYRVLVFGYTRETMRDYVRYNARYLENVEFRILNRSWVAEAADERRHNDLIEALRLRPWAKSDRIRYEALEPWDHSARRSVRYYSGTPVLKAVLLIGQARREAYVSFYNWVRLPPNGGSPFKGADLSMVHLRADDPAAQDVIGYLISQFDKVWECESMTADEVMAMEASALVESAEIQIRLPFDLYPHDGSGSEVLT